VRESALCEALERGARRHDDRDLLAELVELRERVAEVPSGPGQRGGGAGALVTSMSGALVDLRL
jgi:hypothetical protein